MSVNCPFFRYELDLRMVSTEDNFLQDGNGQESFLCLVSSRSELTALTQRKRSCAFLFWKKGGKWKKRKVFLSGNLPLNGSSSYSPERHSYCYRYQFEWAKDVMRRRNWCTCSILNLIFSFCAKDYWDFYGHGRVVVFLRFVTNISQEYCIKKKWIWRAVGEPSPSLLLWKLSTIYRVCTYF